jgi:hypothetical protein
MNINEYHNSETDVDKCLTLIQTILPHFTTTVTTLQIVNFPYFDSLADMICPLLVNYLPRLLHFRIDRNDSHVLELLDVLQMRINPILTLNEYHIKICKKMQSHQTICQCTPAAATGTKS